MPPRAGRSHRSALTNLLPAPVRFSHGPIARTTPPPTFLPVHPDYTPPLGRRQRDKYLGMAKFARWFWRLSVKCSTPTIGAPEPSSRKCTSWRRSSPSARQGQSGAESWYGDRARTGRGEDPDQEAEGQRPHCHRGERVCPEQEGREGVREDRVSSRSGLLPWMRSPCTSA